MLLIHLKLYPHNLRHLLKKDQIIFRKRLILLYFINEKAYLNSADLTVENEYIREQILIKDMYIMCLKRFMYRFFCRHFYSDIER